MVAHTASRQLKLKCLRPNSEDGAGSSAYHLFGHASQEHVCKATATVSADHNHISLTFSCLLNNASGGAAFFCAFVPGDPRERRKAREERLPLTLNVFSRQRGDRWERSHIKAIGGHI